MYDNTHAHYAGIFKNYVNEIKISRITWSARSPVLKALEHTWGKL